MKVILPLAGKGTRLLPLTKHVPKPLVSVAGRPVMDYVMDRLEGLDIEELIIITGHLKEQVERYVGEHYQRAARFIEQKVQDGTAGAVNLARPYVDGPVLIIFVDTVFEADLTLINRTDADGIIWAKEVEDYQRFGVVVTDEDGYMTKIVEKPSEPVSRLANIGLYYIRDWQTLFDGISKTLAGPPTKGEWFLTDAFQYMIDRGRRIATAQVNGWYDCGKAETLLETNQHLLSKGRATRNPAPKGVSIVEPVRLGTDVQLTKCTIGPNVTLGDGVRISSSTISHSIVGDNAKISDSNIDHTLVGDNAMVNGTNHEWMIVTHEEVGKAP